MTHRHSRELERLRARVARLETGQQNPPEAHVLRNAAADLEDTHPDAAAALLVRANRAEHASTARQLVGRRRSQPGTTHGGAQ